MYIDDFIWLPDILEKLAVKHHVTQDEVAIGKEGVMNKGDDKGITSISQASTEEEVGGFWDTHSLADYWGQTQEVEFEVRARRRRRVTLAPDVYEKVAAQARAHGLSPETLVNLWLTERLQGTG